MKNVSLLSTFFRQVLPKAPQIKPPDWVKHFELLYEASNESVGVVLFQHDGNDLNIIHHASRTLNNAQINYPVVEKEFFAVVFGCEKFISYITDSKVRVHTNREGLKEILERTDVKPRMIRWIYLFQEFDLQIFQMKEEPLGIQEPPDEAKPQGKVATICVPPGTLHQERGFSHILCDGLSKHLLPTIHKIKREII
jgi:hypothetical protein